VCQESQGILGTEVRPQAEPRLDQMILTAERAVTECCLCWFQLPAVASAWRLDSGAFEQTLNSLCEKLALGSHEARALTARDGRLVRDPANIPIWAKDLWTLSRNAVNFMYQTPDASSHQTLEVPEGVLPPLLIAGLKNALDSGRNSAAGLRQWFVDAMQWICDNPPSRARVHGVSLHRAR
jgi:hypothetical protein